MQINLDAHQPAGASVAPMPSGGWRLSIPSGPAGAYRLAQLDDYLHRSRQSFLWQPPLQLTLNARVSQNNHQGTWGFGVWNDPFSAGLGLGGMTQRLPVLPNAAWFFYASPPNYLSLEDDLPAQGFLAATFRSPLTPSILLAPAIMALPLLIWPAAARLIRRAARWFVRGSASKIELDTLNWQQYQITWLVDQVIFTIHDVSSQRLLFTSQTALAPRGRCGLVLWIDNQYAAFTPKGHLAYGSLANQQPAWLELDHISVEKL